MYDPNLEKLIEIALEDGEITEKERTILFKKAQALGIDLDEFEMVLESRLKNRMGAIVAIPNIEKKINKHGDLTKCPSCGAQVVSFTIKCKECDYEFRNINANLTIKILADKLDAINPYISFESSLELKKSVIMNHPIPNTKEDILELALFVASNLNGDVNKGLKCCFPSKYGKEITDTGKIRKLNDIWIEKYHQIVSKSKVFAKEDPNLKKQLLEIICQKDVRSSSIINGNMVALAGCFLFLVDIIFFWPFIISGEGSAENKFGLIGFFGILLFLFSILFIVFCPIITAVINGFIGCFGLNKIVWDK